METDESRKLYPKALDTATSPKSHDKELVAHEPKDVSHLVMSAQHYSGPIPPPSMMAE